MCDLIMPYTSDDGSLKEDSALYRFGVLLHEACKIAGAASDSALHYKQQLLDAGFQNVGIYEYKWPTNTWPKDRKHKEIGKCLG